MELFSLQSGRQRKCSSIADPTFNAYCNDDVMVHTPNYSVYNLDSFVKLVLISVDFCNSDSRLFCFVIAL